MRNLVACLMLFLPFCSLSKGLPSQSSAEILEFRTRIVVERNRLVTDRSFIIQINGPASEWIAEISLPFKEGDKLDIMDAAILDKNGIVVRTLRKDEIQVVSDISAGIFYSDTYSKNFSLHWNDYPYIIRYSYRHSVSNFIYIAYWYPYLYGGVPVRKALLDIEIPAEYKVSVRKRGNLNEFLDIQNNTQVLKFEAENLPFLENEYLSLPLNEIMPRVVVFPDEFKYELKGKLDSWASLGTWFDNLNAGLDVITPEEAKKVDKMISGITDKREIIRRLYHYLQDNTHYVNVAIETGGLKPYPASYVCTNKYGDCKALTIYMKALLSHAGIKSFYTLVNAGQNATRVDENMPGQWFNHVILCVPIGNDSIWLENTSAFTPFGYIGSFTQDRLSLVVNDDSSKLVRTPELTPDEINEISKYEIVLNEQGAGRARITKRLRGNNFDSFVELKNAQSASYMQKKITELIPLSNYELIDWAFSPHERDDTWLDLTCNVKVRNQIRTLGKSLALKPVYVVLPELENPDKRISALRINCPVVWTDSVLYSVSFIHHFAIDLPDDVVIESKYGKYISTTLENEGIIHFFRQISIQKGEYDVKEYKEFYSFYSSILDTLKKTYIIFNPVEK